MRHAAASSLREPQHLQREVKADNTAAADRLQRRKSQVARPCAEIENERVVSGPNALNRLLSSAVVETETDHAVKQIVTPRNPVEHVLHGAVTRVFRRGHCLMGGVSCRWLQVGSATDVAARSRNLCR